MDVGVDRDQQNMGGVLLQLEQRIRSGTAEMQMKHPATLQQRVKAGGAPVVRR
jgi:hypothetical protein